MIWDDDCWYNGNDGGDVCRQIVCELELGTISVISESSKEIVISEHFMFVAVQPAAHLADQKTYKRNEDNQL